MHRRMLLVAAVVVLAGCSALGGGAGDTTTAPATETTTTLETVTNESAVAAARSAEIDAASDQLYGTSTYTNVAIPYTGNGTEQVQTTVIANNDSGIFVRVALPVAYDFDCGDRSGRSQARFVGVYRVSPDGQIDRRSEPSEPVCG